MDNKKLKDLAVRTLSGLVMLLVVVGALIWSKWSAGALFAVIMIGGLLEFYRLCQKRGVAPMYAIGIATSLAAFGLACALFYPKDYSLVALDVVHIALVALLYVMLMVPATFVCELWRKSATPIANIATTFMGIIYVALPMAAILYIPQLLVGEWNP